MIWMSLAFAQPMPDVVVQPDIPRCTQPRAEDDPDWRRAMYEEADCQKTRSARELAAFLATTSPAMRIAAARFSKAQDAACSRELDGGSGETASEASCQVGQRHALQAHLKLATTPCEAVATRFEERTCTEPLAPLLAVQDHWLNLVWSLGDRGELALSEQRTWVGLRDAVCESLNEPDRTACLLYLTDTRTDELFRQPVDTAPELLAALHMSRIREQLQRTEAGRRVVEARDAEHHAWRNSLAGQSVPSTERAILDHRTVLPRARDVLALWQPAPPVERPRGANPTRLKGFEEAQNAAAAADKAFCDYLVSRVTRAERASTRSRCTANTANERTAALARLQALATP